MGMASRIGPYSVDREIGRGGMGVVYLARDTRLGRSVALKALPEQFASDAMLRTRFEREARLLAGLSHPNIATVHGLEEADGVAYLVLEFVDGATLVDRVARSRLPVDEALNVCAQIAAAVEAAHEAGVIHRDLKPGNVMLTDEGRIKVLDFGLAREVGAPRTSSQIAQAQTLPRSPATQAGTAIGTPGYMSPEQARGKMLDKRSDIWSFGCILFECLSGEMAFAGETASDCIAAILERDPDWSKLPAKTPLRVRELLKRCLEKDVKRRWRDAGDARLEIEQALANREWSTASMPAAAGSGGWRGKPILAWGIATVSVGALAVALALGNGARKAVRSPFAAAGPVRSTVILPAEPRFNDTIWGIRPDGRAIYYIAQCAEGPDAGVPQLYMRPLDEFEVKPVAGTLGVTGFGFSPDGQHVVFTSYSDPARERARLSRVDAEGGVPVLLAEGVGDYYRMPIWMEDGTIAMRRGEGFEIAGVPSTGGEPRTICRFDPAETPYPIVGLARCMAPDSPWLVVTVPTGDSRGFRGSLWAVSTKTGERHRLLDNGTAGYGVPTGHILFTRGDSLLAAMLDPQRCQISGPVVPLMNGLRSQQGQDSWAFDVSADGTLVYVAGGMTSGDRQLATVDTNGKVEALSQIRADFVETARPSPDGTMICGQIVEPNGLYGLYIYHIGENRLRRLPAPGIDCNHPVWMPQGKQIVYPGLAADRSVGVYRRRVDGIGEPEVIDDAAPGEPLRLPLEMNPEGHGILCKRFKPGEPSDIILMLANRQVLPLLATSANEPTARISPDGHWLAYLSDASGRMELYVKRMPASPGGPGSLPAAPSDEQSLMISSAGADNPRWSRDGSTLYFREPPARWMKTTITAGPALAASRPEFMFSLDSLRMANEYLDVGPGDGQFTFIQRGPSEENLTQINIVQNWLAEVQPKLNVVAPASQP